MREHYFSLSDADKGRILVAAHVKSGLTASATAVQYRCTLSTLGEKNAMGNWGQQQLQLNQCQFLTANVPKNKLYL